MVEIMEPVNYDSYEEDSLDEQRPAERWAPLGAAASNSPSPHGGECNHCSETDALRQLEEEQEMLNSSLLALTTHFAQVQFRLKQIVSAEAEEKENLLKELEEFAFRGIPDVRGCHVQDAQILEEVSDRERESKINEQRQKQLELITQLKNQLEDLETYAYETGHEQLPTSKVLEKQKIVIEQLQKKLKVEDLEHFDNLSAEELRSVVDNAIGQIVNPAKVKEKLVDQLKTQITDLERFIEFLQVETDMMLGEAQTPGASGPPALGNKQRCTCACPVHKTHGNGEGPNKGKVKSTEAENTKRMRDKTSAIVRRALALVQIFAVSQFGCGGHEFQRNVLKRTTKGNHYGDLLARLQLAVDKVVETVRVEKLKEENLSCQDSDYTSDSEETVLSQNYNQEITATVRKDLAPALRDLIQHGLMEVGQSKSLVPFGCFAARSSAPQAKMMHGWDLFVKYYEMKHGREYNESPARTLSQSFDLEVVGGKAITSKQTLLSTIGTIEQTHNPLKRTEDSKFKAFICAGLNEKKLSAWFKMVLRNSILLEYYYQPWSYVVKTGFEDALKAMTRLQQIDFKLPTDLAVRQFKNIKDAF